MKRIYVNEQWCLGCHLCEYYCAFASCNEKDMARALLGKKIQPKIHIEESKRINFAVSCRHCDNPLCVKACVSGALSIKNHVITIDKDRCVGCFTCVATCPYGAISPTQSGAVDKCELCTNNSCGAPNCVTACPNGAIVYEER